MASIKRRPDGSWRARYRDPCRGQGTRIHGHTRAEAERKLDEATASLVRGDYVDPKAGRTTFRDYTRESHALQPKQGQRRAHLRRAAARLHVYPTLGHRKLRTIKPSDVQALVSTLGEQLAPGTVEVVLRPGSRPCSAPRCGTG